MFGPAMSSLFKASVFQMFEQDTEGCICARHFLTYLSLRSAMVQMVGTPGGSKWLPAWRRGSCGWARVCAGWVGVAQLLPHTT